MHGNLTNQMSICDVEKDMCHLCVIKLLLYGERLPFLHHSLKRIITSGQVLPWQFQVVHVYCSIKYEQTQHLDLVFVP